MPKDSPYLHDIPLPQAREYFRQALEKAGLWGPLGEEELPLDQALGRVTAGPIWAQASAPHYHAAAMDGYALRAVDTLGASDRSPVTLAIGNQAVYIDTGDLMPDWSDAVVPIEQVEPVGDTDHGRATEAICLRAALAPWTHVRPMGEDIVATELVLPGGHILRPVDLGAIAGSGHDRVSVRRKPRVAIIPTGSELVPVGTPIKPGDIIEYNTIVLGAQVETWGGLATRFPITPDDSEAIKSQVLEAAKKHDLVLVNAGSSAGSEDFTASVVESVGELLVHGIAVRPGHPVILGIIQGSGGSNVPVIGVPGYPVSAALTGELFVEPLLAVWLGKPAVKGDRISAVMTRKIHSSLGDDEFLRVTVGRVGARVVAAPLSRGAGVITSLVRADGIVRIPAGTQGLEAGTEVLVDLYRSRDQIDRTILALGSHDLSLDLMSQFLAPKGARLSSANLGSVGGLVALSRREAHLAGCHLLDPDSGEYNLSYAQRYLPGVPKIVLGLVEREQGLIVAAGNPSNLTGLEDLPQEGTSFVNRQRGAGTRVLLDYHLERLGLDPDQIDGYDREEYTHLAVGAAVASGRATCGLGIRAAASALGLDFVPLWQERYDLVIPLEHYQSPLLAPLLELLGEEAFQSAVAQLPGYTIAPMGTVIAELGG